MNRRNGKRKRGEDREENNPALQKVVCVFCKSSIKNKYWLGKMMSLNGLNAHYYCILFSPGLEQKGELNDGLKGFLIGDIQKEVRRAGLLSCSYCHIRGASIGCCVADCKIKFHLNCGLANNSFHNFHAPDKTYPSYCSQHRPIQRIARINQKGSEEICVICTDEVVRSPTPKTLLSPCCGNWLHRECVIKQAYHSGKYHFKCPKCNDRRVFVNEMKAYGVNVPSCDASWEKGETFTQMFKKEYKCCADICLSRKGVDHNGDNEWELLTCDGCGANAIHVACAKLKPDAEDWLCTVCQPILDTCDSKKLKLIQQTAD